MSGATSRENSHGAESAEHEHEEDEAGGSAIGGLSAGLMAGGGAPLPPALLGQMQGSFGADFSAVRVHEDGQADELGAHAFAHGSDIHFAAGQYNPDSHQGRELIGHELAHVVQQGGKAGGIGPQGRGADLGGSMSLEREADIAGTAAARGERAHVTGTGAGIQFKKPVDRGFLNAAKAAQAQAIGQAHVEELKKRLSAKAELRFTNADDGQLIEDLQKAASDRVKEVAGEELTDPKQQSDVEAISQKIAQRSKAVKQAVSEKSKTIGAEIASQGYLHTFKAVVEKAFDETSVSRISIKPLVIQQAIASAKMAANRIDEREYQKAKLALDTKLLTEKVQLKSDLEDDSKAKVEPRALAATAKRQGIDTELTTIAQQGSAPAFKNLHDEVEKYVANGLGANGASWFRSDQVREFRKQMKTAARKQAVDDVDTNLTTHTELGKARSRYVGVDAKIGAYDEAKESVNTALSEHATEMTDKLMVDEKVEEGILVAARQAAFAVYENEGQKPAAKAAAIAGAVAHAKKIHDHVMAEAKTRKDAIVKPAGAPIAERAEIETEVVKQVQTDEVGKKSVDAAIKGSSPEDGMSKLGSFFDFMVPERGDSVKFKVSLEVPAGPGNVLIELQGEAERGTRERLIHKDSTTGTKTLSRDTQSLKIGAELRIGYSGTFPGIKIQGALGFFMRSDAASTDMCMKALSYGIYRFLTGAIPPLANLWGGSSKKATAMAESDPTDIDEDLKDDVYRSELWAAMIEEEVFKKDKEARVDLGMSLSGGGEVDGGVAKAKAGLRFEGMRTYDHQAFKKSLRKYNSTHTNQQKLGDDQFDKDGAKERREAISGRTTGGFVLESEVEVEIGGQKCVFGLKVKITPPDFEVEISGGIKLSSSDPADEKVRLYAGIASAGHSVLKTLVSLVRRAVDKDPAMAGVVGGVSDLATHTLVDLNNIANNKVGDVVSEGYQVGKGQEDFANQGINKFLGGDAPTKAPEPTKAGFQSEQTYKVGIIFGNVKQFILKVDEVQSQKLKVGGPGGPGLNIEYEKSRRVAQIGVSGGKFHAEGLGVSTKT